MISGTPEYPGPGGGSPSPSAVPNAVIDVSSEAAFIGEDIVLRDVSTGPVSFRKWNFGDGTSSEEATVSKSWEAEGSYTVELTVYNADGVSDSASVVIQIGSYDLVISEESIEPSKVSVGDEVTAKAHIAGYTGSVLATITWQDGTEDHAFLPYPLPVNPLQAKHTYQKPGTYSPKLTLLPPRGPSISKIVGDVTVTGITQPPNPPTPVTGIAAVAQNQSGMALTNYPMMVTIPLPRTGANAITSTNGVQAYDQSGAKIPCSSKVMARWFADPDDIAAPIRHLNVCFRGSAPAGGLMPLTIRTDEAAPLRGSMSLQDQGGFYRVSPVPGVFYDVEKTNLSIFREIKNGQETMPFGSVVYKTSAGLATIPQCSVTITDGVVGSLSNQRVEIIQEVVLETQVAGLAERSFWVRMTFWSGCEDVVCDYSLTNGFQRPGSGTITTHPSHLRLDELVVIHGKSTSVIPTMDTIDGIISDTTAVEMHCRNRNQTTVSETNTADFEDIAVVSYPSNVQAPKTHHRKLSSYRTWKNTTGTNHPEAKMDGAVGVRLIGTRKVAVAIEGMWDRGPKSVRVTPSDFRVGLFPPAEPGASRDTLRYERSGGSFGNLGLSSSRYNGLSLSGAWPTGTNPAGEAWKIGDVAPPLFPSASAPRVSGQLTPPVSPGSTDLEVNGAYVWDVNANTGVGSWKPLLSPTAPIDSSDMLDYYMIHAGQAPLVRVLYRFTDGDLTATSLREIQSLANNPVFGDATPAWRFETKAMESLAFAPLANGGPDINDWRWYDRLSKCLVSNLEAHRSGNGANTWEWPETTAANAHLIGWPYLVERGAVRHGQSWARSVGWDRYGVVVEEGLLDATTRYDPCRHFFRGYLRSGDPRYITVGRRHFLSMLGHGFVHGHTGQSAGGNLYERHPGALQNSTTVASHVWIEGLCQGYLLNNCEAAKRALEMAVGYYTRGGSSRPSTHTFTGGIRQWGWSMRNLLAILACRGNIRGRERQVPVMAEIQAGLEHWIYIADGGVNNSGYKIQLVDASELESGPSLDLSKTGIMLQIPSGSTTKRSHPHWQAHICFQSEAGALLEMKDFLPQSLKDAVLLDMHRFAAWTKQETWHPLRDPTVHCAIFDFWVPDNYKPENTFWLANQRSPGMAAGTFAWAAKMFRGTVYDSPDWYQLALAHFRQNARYFELSGINRDTGRKPLVHPNALADPALVYDSNGNPVSAALKIQLRTFSWNGGTIVIKFLGENHLTFTDPVLVYQWEMGLVS